MNWEAAVALQWGARRRQEPMSPYRFPLNRVSFDEAEIIAAVDSLLDGQLTMGNRVRLFERAFADYVGAYDAVMVNSGSSANLLAMTALAERTCHTRRDARYLGDVLVPAVCWSTSVWPILQAGFNPVFVDVDPKTLNTNASLLEAALTPETVGVLLVHALGNSAPMTDIISFVDAHNLIVVEDTCEALGSKYTGGMLGTAGQYGAFSFYYSHHITTGEGGMVVCHEQQDADLLRSLRAHGWSRDDKDRAAVEAKYPEIDPRFLFLRQGYNLRPMEMQAAIGHVQLARLARRNRSRNANHRRIVAALRAHPKWREQLQVPVAASGTKPAWFGLPLLLDDNLTHRRRSYLAYLTDRGVENRPIISGNFLAQPARKTLQRYGCEQRPEDFPGAEEVHERGFFIGVHGVLLTDQDVHDLADILLGF